MSSDSFDLYADEVEEEINELENKYLIFNLADKKLGIEISYIKEIIPLPLPTPIPGMKDADRGVIKLRDKTIPLKDMRKLLGLRSIEDEDFELMDLMLKRKVDHVAWVNELISSVEEQREFKLTTNPHKCEFGKWYDNFKTDDINLSLFMVQFDNPHKKIHKFGEMIKETIANKGYDQAKKTVLKIKDNELQEIIQLFDEVDKHIKSSHRELAIVYELNNELKSVSADKVDGIVEIKEDQIQQKLAMQESLPYSIGIATVNNYPVVLLDLSLIK